MLVCHLTPLLNAWTDTVEILCVHFNWFMDGLKTHLDSVGGAAIGMSTFKNGSCYSGNSGFASI